jgi:hypothetical protein
MLGSRLIELTDTMNSFHQPQLVSIFFREVLFANVRRLLLPILVPNPILCLGSYLEFSQQGGLWASTLLQIGG